MSKVVVDLFSEHAAWSLPSASLATVRAAFGSGWEVCAVESETRAATGGTDKQVTIYQGARVYLGWGIPGHVVRTASETLEWVHTAAAGVGGSLTDDLNASGAILTNSRGIHAEPVSDWVVAAIGFCVRGFHRAVADQRDRRWGRHAFTASDLELTEFSSLRVGIVGLGGIGSAVARKCAALGMEVRAVRRQVSAPRPTDVSWVGGPNELSELAANSDVLVLSLPHTEASANLVDASVLKALPCGAYVLNVSRGGILDEMALLAQLNSGHIKGCVLDVFAQEPLDPKHPFWDHPAVLITPHVSAVTSHYWDREVALIVENVGRFLRGNRLRNVVNLEAGY